MKKIFLNHTNHPSDKWSSEQIAAAEIFGEIIDLPFPAIPPEFEKEEVAKKVAENLKKILSLEPVAVLCQGEFNYTFAMVTFLRRQVKEWFRPSFKRTVQVGAFPLFVSSSSGIIDKDFSRRQIFSRFFLEYFSETKPSLPHREKIFFPKFLPRPA